jgi:hypothetical protein
MIMTDRKRPSDDAVDMMRPPPGLDNNKHADAQRQAARAEVIREKFVCSALVKAFGGTGFDVADYRTYLDELLAGARVGTDPVQRMLVEQLGIAHLRLALLQSQAAVAKSLDEHKVMNAAVARLLAEMRRTALTISELKGRRTAPAARAVPKVKLAQTG